MGWDHHQSQQSSASRCADRAGEWLLCMFVSSVTVPIHRPSPSTHPRNAPQANKQSLTQVHFSCPTRSSNGNKTTRASGPSTAILPGMSRGVSMLTSWSGLLILRTWLFRRRYIRTAEIGRAIRVGIYYRRSTQGCEVDDGVRRVPMAFPGRKGGNGSGWIMQKKYHYDMDS